MAGVNFVKNPNTLEGATAAADGVILSIEEFPLLAGESTYILVQNTSNIPLKLNQLLTFTSSPDITVDGKSEISLYTHFNIQPPNTLLSANNVKVLANSYNGAMYNIKGALVEVNKLEDFDVEVHSRFLLVDKHFVTNKEATGTYLPQSTQKVLTKPLYIGVGGLVVIRVTNTNITTNGIDTKVSITFLGQFATSKQGLPYVPLNVDNETITVDNIDITVDQTEL